MGRVNSKRTFRGMLLFFIYFFSIPAAGDWAIDLSRRRKDLKPPEQMPTADKRNESFFDFLTEGTSPAQEIVLLNTPAGFVPSTLRLREGQNYKIHIVNVNENQKNVSFILDSFAEHHATFFGKVKTFQIEPKKTGVYPFSCPETAAQGRIVIYSPSSPVRRAASTE